MTWQTRREGVVRVVGEDGIAREIVPAVKHVLSKELQQYFDKVRVNKCID